MCGKPWEDQLGMQIKHLYNSWNPKAKKSLYLASQTLLPEVSRPDPADPGLDHAWSGPLLTKPGFSGAQALSPQSLSPKSCPILTFTFVLTPVFGSGAPAAGSGRSALPSCRGSQGGTPGFLQSAHGRPMKDHDRGANDGLVQNARVSRVKGGMIAFPGRPGTSKSTSNLWFLSGSAPA